MSTAQPRQRRPRADARRNYERLLTEADAAFREHGTGASLEHIARQSGVAIGTLYAHFPNRRALVSALLQDRHKTLFELGDRLVAQHSAADALTTWVRAVVAHAAAYQGLAALLADGLDDKASELHDSCTRMATISDTLITNAREAGAIRADVTGADILTLMTAAAWIREQISEEQSDRLVTHTMDGLRPEAGERIKIS